MKTIEGHDVKIFTDNIEENALEKIYSTSKRHNDEADALNETLRMYFCKN